jgi:S-adenosylmethionine:tRNA ribosyltransferase-isomerase
MRVELFDFELPPGHIAHAPATPRDSARLLHVSDVLHDRIVRDLPQLLQPGDVLVMNNSRVIPARLFAEVNGKQVEVLLHQPIKDGWLAFARPAKKLKAGIALQFAEDFTATVIGRTEDGQVKLALAICRCRPTSLGRISRKTNRITKLSMRHGMALSPHPPQACTSPRN